MTASNLQCVRRKLELNCQETTGKNLRDRRLLCIRFVVSSWEVFGAEFLLENEYTVKLMPVISLMSRIERKYCLISTSCLTGLFDISILLHI